MDTPRRKILKITAAAAITTLPATIVGCSKETQMHRKLKFTSLMQGLHEAERLAGLNPKNLDSKFTLPQTLVHCAQSIEYSIAGFPEMKSALFQNTVGGLAFRLFSWRGHMSHNLGDAIPGAEPLGADIAIEKALARLKESIDSFTSTTGQLKPHFAYGELSKDDYEMAHAMHLANHFAVIDT